MKTAKAAALLAVILLLSISFGACSANNAAAETEASQQTPEATSTPDVTVELDTSEDKGAGKSNAGSMSGSDFLKLRTRCGTTILRFYISLLITI